MCGFGSDQWVLALLKTKSYIPLSELGPDHESWGMKDAGGGKLSILDKAKQHKAYAETGSLGNYLFKTYGINQIKRLQRLSQEKDRPWQDVFGSSLQELEANWLKHLRTNAEISEENVSIVLKLFERNPGTACSEAQKLVPRKQQTTRCGGYPLQRRGLYNGGPPMWTMSSDNDLGIIIYNATSALHEAGSPSYALAIRNARTLQGIAIRSGGAGIGPSAALKSTGSTR